MRSVKTGDTADIVSRCFRTDSPPTTLTLLRSRILGFSSATELSLHAVSIQSSILTSISAGAEIRREGEEMQMRCLRGGVETKVIEGGRETCIGVVKAHLRSCPRGNPSIR